MKEFYGMCVLCYSEFLDEGWRDGSLLSAFAALPSRGNYPHWAAHNRLQLRGNGTRAEHVPGPVSVLSTQTCENV